MEMRTVGSTGLRLSALGLGCMGMSDFYGTRDDAQSLATIHRALDVGVTLAPAQVALAWLLAQGDDIVPIPGTKRVRRVEENLGALSLRLEPDDVVRLEAAFEPGAVAGARYGRVGVTLTQR